MPWSSHGSYATKRNHGQQPDPRPIADLPVTHRNHLPCNGTFVFGVWDRGSYHATGKIGWRCGQEKLARSRGSSTLSGFFLLQDLKVTPIFEVVRIYLAPGYQDRSGILSWWNLVLPKAMAMFESLLIARTNMSFAIEEWEELTRITRRCEFWEGHNSSIATSALSLPWDLLAP